MTIEQIIREHLEKSYLQDQPNLRLTNDTNLIDENVLDSLGIFMLINFLDERFGTTVEPNEVILENFETVGTVASLVRSKQHEAGEQATGTG
jgi:acyl carrier protein